MKQHISIEQLNDLSDYGKDRLCKWWVPQPGDLVVDRDGKDIETIMCCEDEIDKEIDLPILSIGQMIELLRENITDHYYGDEINFTGINVSYRVYASIYIDDSLTCDNLWDACKQVLEKKE